jgi:hypothetical protein
MRPGGSLCCNLIGAGKLATEKSLSCTAKCIVKEKVTFLVVASGTQGNGNARTPAKNKKPKSKKSNLPLRQTRQPQAREVESFDLSTGPEIHG